MKFNVKHLFAVMIAAASLNAFAETENGKILPDRIEIQNDTKNPVYVEGYESYLGKAGETVQPNSTATVSTEKQKGTVEIKVNGRSYSLLYPTYNVRPKMDQGSKLDTFKYKVSDIIDGKTNHDGFTIYTADESLVLE